MKKTSIHVQPVKPGSEQHNTREKSLDYVREDLTHLNESFSTSAIDDKLADIHKRYKETTGQKMQKKATPVREGVVVIDQSTSMKQLKEFADKCEQEFGIKTFQIHMHKDEGHKRAETWKPNYHAHIVFDWTDEKGKSIKLKPNDMAQMQTILADCLQMERGVSSDKKHLSSIQFKNAAEEERKKELLSEIKINSEELKSIKSKKSTQKLILRLSEFVLGVFGISRYKKENLKLSDALKTYKHEYEKLSEKYSTISEYYNKLQRNNQELLARCSTLNERLQKKQDKGKGLKM